MEIEREREIIETERESMEIEMETETEMETGTGVRGQRQRQGKGREQRQRQWRGTRGHRDTGTPTGRAYLCVFSCCCCCCFWDVDGAVGEGEVACGGQLVQRGVPAQQVGQVQARQDPPTHRQLRQTPLHTAHLRTVPVVAVRALHPPSLCCSLRHAYLCVCVCVWVMISGLHTCPRTGTVGGCGETHMY